MRTLREERFGKLLARLVEVSTGLKGVLLRDGRIVAQVEGTTADEVWRKLTNELGRSAPGFWGYDDAKKRFLANFPGSFQDPDYLAQERQYKLDAAAFIAEHVPLEAARDADASLCDAANKAFTKTNMMTPIEKTRIKALLLSPKGPEFLRASAELADGNAGLALSKLDTLMRPHGQPSWPCATYFPFFWRRETSMYLKPQVTQDFAARVGHRFVRAYDARLNGKTYEALLELTAECEVELSDLRPDDHIDIQSFIWVVGSYPDPNA